MNTPFSDCLISTYKLMYFADLLLEPRTIIIILTSFCSIGSLLVIIFRLLSTLLSIFLIYCFGIARASRIEYLFQSFNIFDAYSRFVLFSVIKDFVFEKLPICRLIVYALPVHFSLLLIFTGKVLILSTITGNVLYFMFCVLCFVVIGYYWPDFRDDFIAGDSNPGVRLFILTNGRFNGNFALLIC
jgi:hypothetical protein